MKKQILKYLLIFFLIAGASAKVNAQVRIYVKARPSYTVVERPPMPHPHYVWIADEWTVSNGVYVHVPGYWAAPRRGFVWIPGHWATTRMGDYWIHGHWRRV